MSRRRANPAPLLAAVAAFPWVSTAIGTALVGLGLWSREEREAREAAAYEEYKASLQPPAMPPAPAAPQIREEMSTWTPETATDRFTDILKEWRKDAILEPQSEEKSEPWVWVAIGGAALGVVMLLKD